ncbi:hypothetical protein JCM11491_004111 [Sporobolomyces phaffii]
MTTGSHSLTAKPRRGRKQDDSLPPSRARDVQRAFRARRAAHLANLEAKNAWLEQENLELRRRLGMGEDDPPISGPEPEMLPLGSPGGSSKGEETFVKGEEETSPPLFNWDEQAIAAGDKGKGKDVGDAHSQDGVQSWNARRIEGIPNPNSLGFDFSQVGWDGQVPGSAHGRPNGTVQPSPGQQHQQIPYHLLPPPPPHHFENNPLAYLATLPMGTFGGLPPPPHLQHPGNMHYEPYPMAAWPPPQRHAQAQQQNAHQAF